METEVSQPVPVRLQPGPLLDIFHWLISWAVFAGSFGVIADFAVHRALAMERVVTCAIAAFLALLFLSPATFLIDAFGALGQHAWDQYDWRFAKKLIAFYGLLLLATASPLVWLVVWLLRRSLPPIAAWVHAAHFDAAAAYSLPGWQIWAVLIAANALLLWFVLTFFRRHPFYSFHQALTIFGWRKCVGGILLMAYLRLLVPRRDFFTQAPFISWAPVLAVPIVLYALIPIRVFAITTPLLLLIALFPYYSSALAPPVWIFLAGSEFNSFRLFYVLRGNWKRHGLNLLNRVGKEGLDFYSAWRSSIGGTGLFYNPDSGRVWSLRTRPGLWQTAVRLLAAFVPVIVVDATSSLTSNVEFELDWLKNHNLFYKVVMVKPPEHVPTKSDSPAPGDATMIDEDTLLASNWIGKTLHL